MKVPAAVALFLSLAGAGCGSSSTSPSTVTTTQTPVAPTQTETFRGTLAVGATRFYSFSVAQYGTVNLTLTALTGDIDPATSSVTLGLGRPSGTGCALGLSVTAFPTSTETPHTSNILDAGVYCAQVTDSGTLTAPAAFTVAIAHP